MNHLKGYKPVELNSGDLKQIEKFSELEFKDSKVVDEVSELLSNKNFNGIIFALRKDKKYKSVYIFKDERNESNEIILKFYKSVTLDEVETGTIKTFEDVIIEELKEIISTEETWKRVIWNDRIVEPRIVRIGSINLSVSILGILLGVMLGIVLDNMALWITIGIIFGISCGAVVSKVDEKKDKK
ncbi:MAG: hypothetical protein IJH12_06115 [Clostridia bacterium]|nr:hypothetical protein [Clostridia bacterium]